MDPSATTMTRRDMLCRSGMGMGNVALACLLADADRAAAGSSSDPLAPRQPPRPARARRVLHLFMEGAPSHLDTFDPKPALGAHDGQVIPRPNGDRPGRAFGSPFRFARHGRGGVAMSELFPRLARHADDLCVINSMHTDDPGHEPAMLLMNCGNARLARPSVGAWVTYGLGSENRNLPGFVALYNENQPLHGPQNWQSAFLPGVYQGVGIDTQRRNVEELIEHIRSPHASDAEQRLQLDLLGGLNRLHRDGRAEDSRLDARIRAFELAYRMQAEAADAFDLTREPANVRRLYGNTPQGRQCLLARRLLERGVRFVQVYHNGWDHHENLTLALRDQARDADQAAAALLIDLKRRGLLNDTLVLWGGEFGRTPTADSNPSATRSRGPGRDHNHRGFTVWLAGGGVKGGYTYGATDDLGFEAVADSVHVHDLHATMLHLLGFDHEQLTYRHSGRDFRLTDVHGRVVEQILA
jgi:Protein of unknown function (DUF1501)